MGRSTYVEPTGGISFGCLPEAPRLLRTFDDFSFLLTCQLEFGGKFAEVRGIAVIGEQLKKKD
jgi:hypothetical protein